MRKSSQTYATLGVVTIGFAFAMPIANAGSLKDLGKAITYPVKKGAHNAGKTASEGAVHASKGINHAGQAVQYPVQKAGVNASKTSHNTVKDVTKK